MTPSRYFLLAGLLATLLGLPSQGAAAAGKPLRDMVLTMPAETVLATVKKVLPLTIPSQNSQLQGQIILQSLDKLVIHDNILSVQGVLSGKNMVVVTNIAGQDVQLKLGQVTLPITCDLLTRFDQNRRILYVTPKFTDNRGGGNTQEASLGSLLGALGGREYAVDLDALRLINIKMGDKSIPLALEPVNITGTDNSLVFRLLPQVGAPN